MKSLIVLGHKLVILLSFFVHLDQRKILNWFGIEHPSFLNLEDLTNSDKIIDVSSIKLSPIFSIDTLRLISLGWWDNFRDGGLGYSEINVILTIVLILRFIYLFIKYNFVTALTITLVNGIAAWLWYSHFWTIAMKYRLMLSEHSLKIGIESVNLHKAGVIFRKKENRRPTLFSPGRYFRYLFRDASINETRTHLIDPISMAVAAAPPRFREAWVGKTYYLIYRKLIPVTIQIVRKVVKEMKNMGLYTFITRVNAKYCPYLIRWHWTFILIFGVIENQYGGVWNRLFYHLKAVLIPEKTNLKIQYDHAISTQILNKQYWNAAELKQLYEQSVIKVQIVEYMLICAAVIHLSFLIYASFHALIGQYFYIPFLTENSEIHIGPRDKKSIYSGGYTAWQDNEYIEANKKRILPRWWYGWLGKGVKNLTKRDIFYYIMAPIRWIIILIRNIIMSFIVWLNPKP